MIGALVGAAAVGLALGLLGSGGSILTVPVLIYGLGMPEKMAIASSLAIVGAIALFGAVLQARSGHVVWRCIAAFGLPGFVGAAGGGIVAAYIPGSVQLLVFGVTLLAAAVTMLRGVDEATGGPACAPLPRIAGAGLGIGALTAIIGVGGGFLLVPALARFGRLALPYAIGTSLALIALNALTGLAGQALGPGPLPTDPGAIAVFTGVGIGGLLVGQHWCNRLPRHTLRRGFVVLLIAIAAYTFWHALFVA